MIPVLADGGLGRVRDLIPLDRVDYLQSLSHDGLERLAVRHAAVPALPVEVAEAVVAPGQRVARENEQVLEALASLAGSRYRRYGGTGLAVARRETAVGGELVVSVELVDVDADDQLGRRSGTDARDREQAAVGRVGMATASGGNTPRALYGAGAHGHPEATDRRPLRVAITLRQPTDTDIPTGCSQKV